MKIVSKAAAILLLLTATSCITTVKEDTSVQWNTPGAGNPLLPGYFADPTIRKFGDTYYIYATTDGTGNGYGPAQVWMSKDFVNWKNVTMNWPTTEVVWAPDVVMFVYALRNLGYNDLAEKIANNYKSSVCKYGFSENSSAITGKQLRCKAYSWAANAYWIL